MKTGRPAARIELRDEEQTELLRRSRLLTADADARRTHIQIGINPAQAMVGKNQAGQ